MTKKFRKVRQTQKGRVELTAVSHGIGWRVTACLSSVGVVHTSWAESLDEAEAKAVKVVLNWD